MEEFSHECLAIRIKRKLNSTDVIDAFTDLRIKRGVPGYIQPDKGMEFIAEAVRRWITAVGVQSAYIEPGSRLENGYVESFNARLRDEILNGEIFYTLKEAQTVTGQWCRHYKPNDITAHSAIDHQRPKASSICTKG